MSSNCVVCLLENVPLVTLEIVPDDSTIQKIFKNFLRKHPGVALSVWNWLDDSCTAHLKTFDKAGPFWSIQGRDFQNFPLCDMPENVDAE